MKTLLFIFFLIYSINSAPNPGDCTKEELKECEPFEKQLNLYMRRNQGHRMPQEIFDNSTIVCKDVKKCYDNLKCKNAKQLREEFDINCAKLEYLTASIHNCVPKFFKAVYSKKYDCASKFDFLTKDLGAKRKIYNDGKSCFIEVAKEVCNSESLDFLNDNEKYNRLIEVLSVKPDDKCRGLHHTFAAAECRPVVQSLDEFKFDFGKFKINDPKLLAAISRCEEATSCTKNACQYSSIERVELEHACLVTKLVNTPFGQCLSQLKTKPVVANYPCLNGTWPIEKMTLCLKNVDGCVEKVYEGECGKDAVKNFKEDYGILKKVYCHRLF